jgi:hypothetical protein
METNELKFLLKLLAFPDYRTSLAKITPNAKTTAAERERICRKLRDQELVNCSYEVTKLKIAAPGKDLLKLDAAESPLTDQQLKVLRTSEKEKITPGKTGIPAAERQAIIQGLADRGWIEVEQKIKEVWLSERGVERLRDEYNPKGTATISLDLLNNYLRFLRKSLQVKPVTPATNESPIDSTSKPSDKEILQTIQKLDQELGTDNYLPIFHLRQKLQPPLSREELDQALYRLQKNDQIELSSLQEATAYTSAQIDAGIPQNVGGALFFISLT